MTDSRAERDHLIEYVAGTLAPGPTAEVAAHLARCADCRAEAEALSSMRRSLLAGERTDHLSAGDLVAYEEGEPTQDAARRRGIEAHLDECETCRDDLQALERARRVHEALSPAPTVSRLAGTTPVTRRVAARRSWSGWAVVAAVAGMVVAAGVVTGLRPTPAPDPALQPVRPILFAAPRRGAAEARVLPAVGPWSITVLLPFGAPDGSYRLQIEREDGTPAGAVGDPIPTDADHTLTVLVKTPLAVGRYRLTLDPQAQAEGTPFVYPFEVGPSAPGGAGDGRR